MEESYFGLKINGESFHKKKKDDQVVNHKHVFRPKLETLLQKWGAVH